MIDFRLGFYGLAVQDVRYNTLRGGILNQTRQMGPMMNTFSPDSTSYYEDSLHEALLRWFDDHHLVYRSFYAEDPDHVTESVALPLIALGKYDGDFRYCPHPQAMGYTVKPLDEMSLDDFHDFVLLWYEAAARAGILRCFGCDKPLRMDDRQHPWDALFSTEDMIFWLAIHFDCKKLLKRELKGRNAFELQPRPAERLELILPEPAPTAGPEASVYTQE